MRISDWSSDVCSSDLRRSQLLRLRDEAPRQAAGRALAGLLRGEHLDLRLRANPRGVRDPRGRESRADHHRAERLHRCRQANRRADADARVPAVRSEEHTSELQSLMRISYAVFCLKKKK